MTIVFLALGVAVLVGTGLALAQRWQPEGLPAAPPDQSPPDPARFDVAWRGYRMDQVDAEIGRLHALIDEGRADGDDAPIIQGGTTSGQ